jgi:hypothetical protein
MVSSTSSTSKALADTLRRGLETFDCNSLAWVAEWFAWDGFLKRASKLEELLEESLPRGSGDVEQFLVACQRCGPFETYAMASLVQHCGLGRDVTIDGQGIEGGLVVAGDATIRGTLVAPIEHWVMVTGTLTVDALVTSADCIVGGSLVARDYVLGINDHNQSFWVKDSLVTPLFVTMEYMATVGDEKRIGEKLDSEDERFDDALAKVLDADVALEIAAHGCELGGGPDHVVKHLGMRVQEGHPLLLAGRT